MNLLEHNRRFLRRKGRLRVYAAADATVGILTRAGYFQLCQIGYARDGSIRVQWPYLAVQQGIVATFELPPEGESSSYTIPMQECGKFTSQLVKYSHHTSGATHFNLTGRTTNEVRRESFPLIGPIGYVFQLEVFYPEGFKTLQRLKPQRLYLVFDCRAVDATAFQVRGEWRRRSSVIENTVGTGSPLAWFGNR
jgi:hypothetical protein